MKKISIILFIGIIIYPKVILLAQEPEWTLYTIADRVNCQLVQDSINWVGTDIGLVKYNINNDSYIFITTSNSGLIGNTINSISAQNNGLLWISTTSGISMFDGEEWTSYTSANSDLPNNYVTEIDFAPDGSIWIATGNGVASITDSSWSIYDSSNSGITNNYIKDIDIDEDNNVWIATWGGGLFSYDGSNWIHINSVQSNCITEVDIDNNGAKWIGTDFEGFICLTDTSQVIYNTGNSMLPSNYISSFTFDEMGGVWIGTNGGGAAYFYENNWIIYDSSNSPMPTSNRIYTIAINNTEDIWFGGMQFFAELEGTVWNEIQLTNSGLPSNYIKSLCTYESDLWIGTQGGICYYNGFDWITYNTNNSSLLGHHARSLIAQFNGDIWATVDGYLYPNVTCPFGIALFSENQWFPFQSDNSPLPSNNVSVITIDNSQRVWSVVNNYLLNIDLDNTEWISYNFQDFGLVNEIACTAISPFGLNNLLIAIFDLMECNFYLLQYDIESNTVINEYDYYNGYGCLIREIKCSNDVIWLATSDGLIKIDDEEITEYNTNNSEIPDDNLSCLEIEDNSIIWIGSIDSGLIRFDGNEWINYNTSNSPIPSNDINDLSISSNNIKWIGTNNGLISLDDTEIIDATTNIIDNYESIIFNYPNPFNPETTILFSLSEESNIELNIYNIKGQKIKALLNNQFSSGEHSIIWNGTDNNNRLVSSGIYFYKLNVNGKQLAAKKCVLLK